MAHSAARSVPLHASDSVQIPVRITAGIPLNGRRRPHPSEVDRKHATWPGQWPPKDGWYDVPTTWREILDSAMTVGRDPSPWLVRFPGLATNELLARVTPLAAYLHHDGTAAPVKLRASPVYALGAEKSAQGAMAYRLGMTMTEWAARALIGLPATTHHEDAQPSGAGSNWFGPGRRPDLWCEDPSMSPAVWAFEAKAARRLAQRNMRDGAGQLAALGHDVLPVPHSRVLVGTSIDDRLFTLLEHETHHLGSASPTGGYATDLFNLTRSRLIIFLFLSSQEQNRLRTVTAARGESTRFSETDEQTREVRSAVRLRQPERRGPLPPGLSDQVREFVSARVPGTGIRVGMSPGLFESARGLMSALEATVAEVARDRPTWSRFGDAESRRQADPSELSEEAELDQVVEFKEAVDGRVRGRRQLLEADYESGEQRGMSTFDYPERVEPEGVLEMYSNETYISLDPDSVLMGPLRR